MATTPSSAYQAEHLVNGKFHIGGTAFDNVVAYQEGQGAAKLDRTPDLFAFMGATQVELAFIVAPEIKGYQDLKGKTLALDALSTGFAFVLYEMLAKSGLKRSDYEFAAVGATPQRWEAVRSGQHVGTITIEPFTSIAKAQGFGVLETSTSVFPVYQGGSFAASRQWAAANPETLKGFIKGYLARLSRFQVTSVIHYESSLSSALSKRNDSAVLETRPSVSRSIRVAHSRRAANGQRAKPGDTEGFHQRLSCRSCVDAGAAES
nr:ABC transporter substrate-binding component [uncultured bacterium]